MSTNNYISCYNRVGRLKLVEDGSGGEAYYYGKLGEVTKTIKSIILAETNIRTYIWEADYDSWNRINTMTYYNTPQFLDNSKRKVFIFEK